MKKAIARLFMKRVTAVFLCVLLLCSSYIPSFAEEWICNACGYPASGNFCSNCGAAKPIDEWICPQCGNAASNNFCSNCGSPRPAQDRIETEPPKSEDDSSHPRLDPEQFYAYLSNYSATAAGFGGDITVKLLLDIDGTVIDATIIGDNETPGLGGKAITQMADSFIGRTIPFADAVDTVTGATFTSNGVIDAIRQIEKQFQETPAEGSAEEGAEYSATAAGFGDDITLNLLLDIDETVIDAIIGDNNETPPIGGAAIKPTAAPTASPTAAPTPFILNPSTPTAAPTAAPTILPDLDDLVFSDAEVLYNDDLPSIRLFARNSVLYTGESNQWLELTVYLDPSITGSVSIRQADGEQLQQVENNGSGKLTTSVLLYSKEEKEFSLYAEADGIRSDLITCSFEDQVTQDMVDTMIALGRDMLAHLDSLGLGGDYSEEALRQAEAFLQSDPRVGHVEWGVGDHGLVLFYLTTDGLVSVYGDMTLSQDAAGFSDGNTELRRYLRQGDLSASDLIFDTELVMTNSNITSLVFEPEDDQNQMVRMSAFCEAKLQLAADNVHSDYNPYTGTEALSALGEGKLGDNGLLVLAGHGLQLALWPTGKDKIVCISIGHETPSDLQGLKNRSIAYSPFHASDCRIIHYTGKDADTGAKVEKYFITPKYLNEKLGDLVFDNTIVFLFVCYGFWEPSLPEAFLSRGAAAVIGCRGSFKTFYAMTLLNSLVNSFLAADADSPMLSLQSLLDNWDREEAEQRFLDDLMGEMANSFVPIVLGRVSEEPETKRSAEEVYAPYLQFIRESTDPVYNENLLAGIRGEGRTILSGEGVILGHVYQKPETADPPVPYANADISVYRWLNHSFSLVARTRTDEDGAYITSPIPAGLYFISAEHFPSSQGHREMDVCGVEVSEEQVTAEDLYLPATAQLTIEVRDESSGNILPGCDLTLVSADPAVLLLLEGTFAASGQTDRKGQWSQEVNKGTYLLTVQRDGYETKTVEISVQGTETSYQPDPVTLRPLPVIGGVIATRESYYVGGEGSHYKIILYPVDEEGYLILDANGDPTCCREDTMDNAYGFSLRVWLLDHETIVVEWADTNSTTIYGTSYDYCVYRLDEQNQLQVIRRVKQSFNRDDWKFYTSFYIGEECVQTFDSLESAEEALREFFMPCGMGFEEWEEIPGTHRTVRILRMAHLSGGQAELIFDIYEKESLYDEDQKICNWWYSLPAISDVLDSLNTSMDTQE